MGEHAEDDKDVADHSDGDETTQDENGEDSLPAMSLTILILFILYHIRNYCRL